MKTGVIVYVAGENRQENPIDMETRVGHLSIDADMVTVVSENEGHFNVSDAWRFLFTKGMKRILCAIAECAPDGNIRLTDRTVRLQG